MMNGNIFPELTAAFLEDREAIKANTFFYISNGFFPSWSTDYRNDADRGLKEYSTETRWTQYKRGEITREKAVELAQKRAAKQLAKRTQEGLDKLAAASEAPELTFASVSVVWNKSRTWGYNPSVESWTDGGRTYGSASGCGYDKQSAAVADAFNNDAVMLKVLYTLKEKALAAGKTDTDTAANTGHDNRNIVGYGAGYSVIPYFEGGVGVGCYWSILKKAGYTVTEYSGKRENSFRIEKADA